MATEIYKSLADVNPDSMKPYCIKKEMPYNVRNKCIVKLPSANSTYYGINSVLFRVCLFWGRLPLSVKQNQSLFQFKSNMKTLRYIVCSCTIKLARYAGHDFVIMYYEQMPLQL